MNKIRHISSPVLAFSALVALCSVAPAQGLYSDILNTFGNADSINSFVGTGNLAQTGVIWDGSKDALGSASSGSARFIVSYSGATNDQFSVSGSWANRWPQDFAVAVDATYYTNLSFDIRVDPRSSLSKASAGADFGQFGVDLLCSVGGFDWVPVLIGSVTVPASATNGWYHVVVPIDQTDANLAYCTGWDIQQTSVADHAGPMTLWVDNLLLSVAPVTQPAMLPPQKIVSSGLWMGTSSKDSSGTRQGIYSKPVTWVGRSEPLTYSITIGDFPSSAANAGFQANLFLVGNGWTGAMTDAQVAAHAPNVACLQILANGDGSAVASFMFKTNTAGDGQVFAANSLAALTSSTALGNWLLTFASDTGVTLGAPDGSTTNFTFPAGAVPFFNDSARDYAVFGTQPGTTANVGTSATFSDVKILSGSKSGTVLMDAGLSTGALDANWGVAADDAAGVVVVPSDAAYWAVWTLPARNFILQVNADPGNVFTWIDLDTITPSAFDGKARAIIPTSFVNTNGLQTNAFFQLINYGQ